MNIRSGVVLVIFSLVVLNLTAFTVNERELAIKLQVGEVVKSDYEPGLHFKIPFYQTIRKFPKRIMTINERPERIFTAERLAMDVDSFVKWRIINTVDFYISTGGSFRVANDRISEIIKNAIVTEFGKRTVQEAISVERAELMRDMLANATSTAEGLGVELVDVRVKQVEFPDDVRNSVYQQMREERGRIAAERRAQGMEVSEEKKSTADKERTIILANANKDSEIIRGAGDAKAFASPAPLIISESLFALAKMIVLSLSAVDFFSSDTSIPCALRSAAILPLSSLIC